MDKKRLLFFIFLFFPGIVSAAPQDNEASVIILIIVAVLIFLIVSLLILLLWIFMLIDCVKREFNTKLKWLLIINLVPLGEVFYYFIIKRRDIRNKEEKKRPLETMALLAFIFGICGYMFFPSFGFILGIPALILGIISQNKISDNKSKGIELAKAGVIIGIVAMIFQVIFFIAYFAFIFGMVFFTNMQMQEAFANGNYTGNLIIEGSYAGYYDGNDCLRREGDFFYKTESVCFLPYNVSVFEKDGDDMSKFDMDDKIWDNEGELVDYSKNVFEGEELFLKEGILNDNFIFMPLDEFSSGKYTYEITVRDSIGKKQGKTKGNFTVI